MTAGMSRSKSFWGWGWEDKFPDTEARKQMGQHASALLGFAPERCDEPPTIDAVTVPETSARIPAALNEVCTTDPHARIAHTYGRSYFDIARGFRGDFSPAPDVVATPATDQEVVAILDWANDARLTVVPYGGGTSVVRGVEVEAHERNQGVVCLDLKRLDQVTKVDKRSLSAHIQGGATGPVLESQLAEHGLTLRHFPQSFEFSTLGGWIATRAGGHFATLYTHIDDLVQSTTMITPSGTMESRRLPGSGAGPSPDRLVLGSEGALGVVTGAWMRVRPRPVFRATATCHFKDYVQAVEAVRALSQSGLYPTNCRLLDKREAMLNGVTMDGTHVLIVAFESADHAVHPSMERALELVSDHGGTCPKGAVYREAGERSGAEGGAGAWRDAFIDAPYLLNIMASMGMIADTFETSCTWDNFERLHTAVINNVRAAMKDACGTGFIGCRFTHVYPDGPAPYFTFIAPGRHGHEAEQWLQIRKVANDTLIEHGSTITHHHAVGRFHRPWYESQRPALFGEALRATKNTLDPNGIMNPGVLLRVD